MFDFSGLNPEQALAAAHPKGAALVLAGPGSGKTLLIVNRIRYLIEYCQAAPENILVITFTRAAAKSMQQRFTEAVCGRAFPVTFGTFHAIFFQILKMYDSYDHHSLLTNKDKMWYLGDILDREYHGASKNLLCQRLLSLFGFYQNHPHVSLEPLLPEEMTEQEFQRIFTAYQNRIRDEGKLDFDDMAERCLELFHKKPEVLRCLQQQYRYVLIDEYQDTNAVQDAVIRKLVGSAQELFAVGDEDQAIYGFRGSAPDIMSSFERRYPGARRYTLEQNYRSTGKIVEAAGKVIAENKQRYPKKMTAVGECGEPVRCQSFEKQEEQYACIVARMKELSVQMPYEEMAVITRTNRELELIAELLRREKIPCDVKERKKSGYRHFIVRDVFACLEYAAGDSGKAPELWRELGGNERKRQVLNRQVPFAALHYLQKTMGYEAYLKNRVKEETKSGVSGEQELWEEWETVLQMLVCSSREYADSREWKKAVEGRIAEWENQNGNRGADTERNRPGQGVQLLTMHGAKGLEFTYVCLPNVNEGIIPGRQSRDVYAVEEERRMLYVGMTRAKKILDILYLTGTKEYPRLPSRFINPLL